MQNYQLLLALAVSSVILFGCSASNKSSHGLAELPEICRGYDFASDPAMAEACGIRQTRYQSYKNLPSQRFLIYPKDANLVLTTSGVELRLSNTHPVILEGDLDLVIDFSPQSQLQKLKNKYIYKEIYPKNDPRIRMFKMIFPTLKGELSYCFKLPNKVPGDRRKRVRMGNVIHKLTCDEFDKLVAENP